MEAEFEKILGNVRCADGEFVLRVVARRYLEYRGHRLVLDPGRVRCEHLDDRATETPGGIKYPRLYLICTAESKE